MVPTHDGHGMRYRKDVKLVLEVHHPYGESFRTKITIHGVNISDTLQAGQK
ncbi:MAG: hypothetical protein ABFD50_16010 [Smithella sp.]